MKIKINFKHSYKISKLIKVLCIPVDIYFPMYACDICNSQIATEYFSIYNKKIMYQRRTSLLYSVTRNIICILFFPFVLLCVLITEFGRKCVLCCLLLVFPFKSTLWISTFLLKRDREEIIDTFHNKRRIFTSLLSDILLITLSVMVKAEGKKKWKIYITGKAHNLPQFSLSLFHYSLVVSKYITYEFDLSQSFQYLTFNNFICWNWLNTLMKDLDINNFFYIKCVVFSWNRFFFLYH